MSALAPAPPAQHQPGNDGEWKASLALPPKDNRIKTVVRHEHQEGILLHARAWLMRYRTTCTLPS